MMFRTHILFALFFYITLIKLFSLEFSLAFTLILCFGAILPDIDWPESYVNKKYLLGLGKGIAFFSRHRGFWHSIYGLGIFIALATFIFLINNSFVFFFALPLGYFLHLAADSLNISGIKWLWKSKKLHLKGKLKTGGVFEQIFFVSLLLLTIYVVIGNQGIREITAFVTQVKT
jgi:inner membrane protein